MEELRHWWEFQTPPVNFNHSKRAPFHTLKKDTIQGKWNISSDLDSVIKAGIMDGNFYKNNESLKKGNENEICI